MYSPVYYPADYGYLEEHLLKEYEHFFSVYKNLEEKEVPGNYVPGLFKCLKQLIF